MRDFEILCALMLIIFIRKLKAILFQSSLLLMECVLYDSVGIMYLLKLIHMGKVLRKKKKKLFKNETR